MPASTDLKQAISSPPHDRLSPQQRPELSKIKDFSASKGGSELPALVTPEDFSQLLSSHQPHDSLILDLRSFAQFSKSRVSGALNLCIPTTLLKRPTYTVQKLAETFASKKNDKAKFNSWRDAQIIIAYDGASGNLAQAAPCVHVLQKFMNEKWPGATFIVQGGFNAFAQQFPEHVETRFVGEMDGINKTKLSIDPSAAVSGGCSMPTNQNPVNPFFGSIRQNTDLIDGVGQIPLKRPPNFADVSSQKLPTWLRNASNPQDQGKTVSNRFLAIEKAEQHRMQKALSFASWQPQSKQSPENIRLAGIEKGSKNRYKDILPFDHSRVVLENPSAECDYVNASHIKSPESGRTRYIAFQAPVPSTFADFWHVIWEQDVRLIVMLTAESEGGQTKSHPYWHSGDYGPFRLDKLNEEIQPLVRLKRPSARRTTTSPSELQSSRGKPPISRRHTASLSVNQAIPPPTPDSSSESIPRVTVRTLKLSYNKNLPSTPHDIIQIQLTTWPDLGTPARPKDILALVELCRSFKPQQQNPKPHPMVVHCSAGCGRTGTFCTVDSVISTLMKQKSDRNANISAANGAGVDRMDLDDPLMDEEKDLIAETVASLRHQRMSMVQTLRQFVLCYEAIMEWFVDS
ncbi:uncharacterized protein KY384_005559 [Bacidia gigantensis]|uniref:uncharacterized protein n=1 Tax=Bacidia gigantensis TaxID=2732470 RepID=UPI001D03C802|nr:uncharacterized protein KY384_005559 [Bacidia gigantensis]KAG8530077.1 hypothetical protein KY384_005559 [Bacidia gigantensis]